MIQAAKILANKVNKLQFPESITHVYNPLDYAWEAHQLYLEKYAHSPKKVVFLGMNPGPWGMAQTGVPFGEVNFVKDWLNICTEVKKPKNEHPKRPIEGFSCKKSEVSGRRLWGLFQSKFGNAENFFKDHFVANYCPLVFMETSGKNFTPDKFPKENTQLLYEACNEHLRQIIEILKPQHVIGVGAFAELRAHEALNGINCHIGKILHPSPASPAANKNWGEKATQQLEALGVWS